MTLSEFILSKPTELRLGQYFYNTYLSRLKPQDRMHHNMSLFYNMTCHVRTIYIINQIMKDYQWEELPE